MEQLITTPHRNDNTGLNWSCLTTNNDLLPMVLFFLYFSRDSNCKFYKYNSKTTECLIYFNGTSDCQQVIRGSKTNVDICTVKVTTLGKLYFLSIFVNNRIILLLNNPKMPRSYMSIFFQRNGLVVPGHGAKKIITSITHFELIHHFPQNMLKIFTFGCQSCFSLPVFTDIFLFFFVG